LGQSAGPPLTLEQKTGQYILENFNLVTGTSQGMVRTMTAAVDCSGPSRDPVRLGRSTRRRRVPSDVRVPRIVPCAADSEELFSLSAGVNNGLKDAFAALQKEYKCLPHNTHDDGIGAL
jgi:hypothetical protein